MKAAAILIAILALAGCDHGHEHGADEHGHGHDEQGHDEHSHDEHAHDDHGDEHGHDDHGHDHGKETVKWTSFAEKTQVFAEYKPLHDGESVEFHIHITRLRDWKALSEGQGQLTLEVSDKSTTSQTESVAPGIFKARLKPPAKGEGTLKFEYNGDVHTRKVSISGDGDHDSKHEGHDKEDGAHVHNEEENIAFGLEQQWSINFGLAPIKRSAVRPTFDAFGVIQPRLGGEGVVHAQSAGRISGDQIPTLGAQVKRGQDLAWLTPAVAEQGDFASLDLAVRQSTTRLRAAKVERDRLQKLVDQGVIPSRRLTEAQFKVEEAEAALAAARSRSGQARGVVGTGSRPKGSIPIKAPIDGIVVSVDVPPGLIVESGRPLFRIVDPDPLWLRIDVPERYVPNIADISGLWFEVEGLEKPLELFDVPISTGGTVDPTSRTLPMVVEVPNPNGALKPGMFADVHVVKGAPFESVVVPKAAIVYEEGVPVAYAMVDGETFERRPLKLGAAAADHIEVQRGLRDGEWVVTDGAFAIRLAALGEVDAGHGHHH